MPDFIKILYFLLVHIEEVFFGDLVLQSSRFPPTVDCTKTALDYVQNVFKVKSSVVFVNRWH